MMFIAALLPLIQLLMLSCTHADDDGISLWGWPYESLGQYMGADDSKEDTNKGFFNNYYMNPYSDSNYNGYGQIYQQSHPNRNPYSQFYGQYVNPLGFHAIRHGDDSREDRGIYNWNRYFSLGNLQHGHADSSENDEYGKLSWNMPRLDVGSDSREVEGDVLSLLRKGFGGVDSSEEAISGGTNGVFKLGDGYGERKDSSGGGKDSSGEGKDSSGEGKDSSGGGNSAGEFGGRDGQDVDSHGQDVGSHGQDLGSHGQDVDSHGQDLGNDRRSSEYPIPWRPNVSPSSAKSTYYPAASKTPGTNRKQTTSAVAKQQSTVTINNKRPPTSTTSRKAITTASINRLTTATNASRKPTAEATATNASRKPTTAAKKITKTTTHKPPKISSTKITSNAGTRKSSTTTKATAKPTTATTRRNPSAATRTTTKPAATTITRKSSTSSSTTSINKPATATANKKPSTIKATTTKPTTARVTTKPTPTSTTKKSITKKSTTKKSTTKKSTTTTTTSKPLPTATRPPTSPTTTRKPTTSATRSKPTFTSTTKKTTTKKSTTKKSTTTSTTTPSTTTTITTTPNPTSSPTTTKKSTTTSTTTPTSTTTRTSTTPTTTSKPTSTPTRTSTTPTTTSKPTSTPTTKKSTSKSTTTTTTTPIPTSSPTTKNPATTTTTTTTLQPPTTPKPVLPEICSGSDVVDGVGYKQHWSDCSKFVQCVLTQDGSTVVLLRSCTNGTLWDQGSLSCSSADLVDCPHDRCKIPGLERYPSATNCRSYWVCQDGKSKTACCPPGHSYDSIKGCVPDPHCLEDCNNGPIIQNVCDRRAVQNKPLMFEQYEQGHGWALVSCAPGTVYNEITCHCSGRDDGASPEIECQPELYIPFNGDITDESGNNNYLQVDGVKVVDGTGYFDGKSLIRVPRFSNLDFGDTVIIKLRYKEDGGGKVSANSLPQALVANGDCNYPSSLYLVTDHGQLDAGLRTQNGRSANVSLPSNGTGWKEAVMMVDKKVLLGSLNGISHQTLFTGSIEPSKCALQIGRGTEFAHFHGYMDDITVYLCKPKGF